MQCNPEEYPRNRGSEFRMSLPRLTHRKSVEHLPPLLLYSTAQLYVQDNI